MTSVTIRPPPKTCSTRADEPQLGAHRCSAHAITLTYLTPTAASFHAPRVQRRVGLRDWFFGEHVTWNDAFSPVHFTQLIFAGEDTTATTTTYATVNWRGSFAGVPPSGGTHKIRICDFYQMSQEKPAEQLKISSNWMMLDVADLCRASGRRVIPQATALPDDGAFMPPTANDGVPAPISAFTGSCPRDSNPWQQKRRPPHTVLRHLTRQRHALDGRTELARTLRADTQRA